MAFSEDVGARYEAYGWHVQNLGEDIGLERVEAAVEAAKAETERPSLIILRTHIGFGSPNKQDSQKAHGSPLGEDEVRLTKEVYGWDPDAHFLVPDEVREHFRAGRARPRGRGGVGGRLEAYRRDNPDWPRELDALHGGPPARRLGRRRCRASTPTTSRSPRARPPAR